MKTFSTKKLDWNLMPRDSGAAHLSARIRQLSYNEGVKMYMEATPLKDGVEFNAGDKVIISQEQDGQTRFWSIHYLK